MIAQIISWSLKNRFLILVATFFLIAFGIYALHHTPVDAIPDLSDVQVIIKTPYPGQAPQVVEDQVTYPLSHHMDFCDVILAIAIFYQHKMNFIS